MSNKKEIFLTIWQTKNTSVRSEYGIISYMQWCKKEMRRIPGTFLAYKTKKVQELICLKKYQEEEK